MTGNDSDNDGYLSVHDCNDADGAIHAGATEICDGFDNDCDSLIDEQGNSLHFDGIDDGIFFSNKFLFHNPGDATLEFWFKCNPKHHTAILWTRPDDTDANRFNIYLDPGGSLGVGYRDEDGIAHDIAGPLVVAGSIRTVPNTWNHLAIVRKGNSAYKIYMNGLLAATGYDSSPNLPTAVGWKIGERSGSMYNGYIDEIRFWNIARTQAEILASMSVHINPENESALVGYYTFDQGAGNGENTGLDSLIDLSSNHTNGVMKNFALTGSTSNWVSPTPVSCFVTFRSHTGSDSLGQQFAVSNPSYGMLYLKHEFKPDEDAQLRITDIDGKEVYNRSLKNPDGSFQSEIEISRLKPGAYTVVLCNDYYASTERLVIPE